MEFDKTAFRAYDIRGIYGKGLDEGLAERLGKTVGTLVGKERYIGVGRDVRVSSDALHTALVNGILSTGCNVVDFGIVPTPLLYFGVIHKKLASGIMITASHLPPEWNGFKLCDSTGVTISEGTGLETVRERFFAGGLSADKQGKTTHEEIIDAYVDFITSKIRPDKELKIVVDFANSVTALVVPQILKRMGQEVIKMFEDLDGRFPNRPSEPNEESLQKLREKVIETGADIGIGYDGDGDRVAFVDEKGRITGVGNTTIPLFAGYFLKRYPGGKVVFDVSCSAAVEDYIKNLGGKPIMIRTGHSYCANEVLKQKALFGGQYSGHIAMPEAHCTDDAIFSSMTMLKIITDSGKSLSELINAIPKYYPTKMKEISCQDDKKFGAVERIKSRIKSLGYKTIDIDGIRAYDDRGWVLIRASNTSPIIRINAEGKTEEDGKRFQQLGEKMVEEELSK